MSVRSKLLAVSALNLMLLLFGGTFAVVQLRQLDTATKRLSARSVPAVISISNINQSLMKYRQLQSLYVASTNSTDIDRTESQMQALEQRITVQLAEYSKLVTAPQDQQVINMLRENLWPNFVQRSHELLITSSQSNDSKRSLAMYTLLEPTYSQVTIQVDRLLASTEKQAVATSKDATNTYQTARIVIEWGTIAVLLASSALTFQLTRKIVTNLSYLTRTTDAVAEGNLDQTVELHSNDELGRLARSFNQMLSGLRTSRAEVAEQHRVVVARTQELEATLAELRESMTAREQLSATIRDLSSPVLPVIDGVLVMPLIGSIDSERATLLTHTLLSAVEQQRANLVLLDVTGVPLVDTQVAQVLLQAAQAVKLLGARTVLVGLRPELAQTIVGLGLDLSELIIHSDLRSGISYALRHSGPQQKHVRV